MLRARRFWSNDANCQFVSLSQVHGVLELLVARRYDVYANLILSWRRASHYRQESVSRIFISFRNFELPL